VARERFEVRCMSLARADSVRFVRAPAWTGRLCLAACLALACGLVVAQSGGSFEIRRSRVATGGGESTGGTFVLRGTAGQHEAQPVASGGAFSLRGGFWTAIDTTPPTDALFRDSFEDAP
jgi:hypothetical protein